MYLLYVRSFKMKFLRFHNINVSMTVCGTSISDEKELPAINLLLPRMIDEEVRWHSILPKFQTKSGKITCTIDQSKCSEFVCCMKAKGVTDFCAIFGWIIEYHMLWNR